MIDIDDRRPETDVAVDGVLGIGGRPGLPDDVARLAQDLANFTVPTIAVDLPSGVGADTGAVPGAAAGRPGRATSRGWRGRSG